MIRVRISPKAQATADELNAILGKSALSGATNADAVALADDGDLVVFDWKSDVAPSGRNRLAYREQLGQYLHVLGAQRGAIVYMTSGRIDWITAAG